jgi:hypothetical protein
MQYYRTAAVYNLLVVMTWPDGLQGEGAPSASRGEAGMTRTAILPSPAATREIIFSTAFPDRLLSAQA